MSALLKSDCVGIAVRAVNATPPQPVESALEREAARLRARVGDLERELVGRQGIIEAVPAQIEAAQEEGHARGYEQGLIDAADRHDARLRMLDGAARDAREIVAAGFASLERLAVGLARDALELVFDDASAQAERVAGTIRKQMAAIEREAVLRVRVSATDFPDAASLEELSVTSGLPATALTAEKGMETGACVMTLQLGEIDIGIGRQSAVVLAELSRFLAAESAT